MLFVKLPWRSKEKPPIFPNPREYWTCKGYEPYSWTEEDIEYAKSIGYYDIHEQEEDGEGPGLKGVMWGTDPKTGFEFYLPKKSHSFWYSGMGYVCIDDNLS